MTPGNKAHTAVVHRLLAKYGGVHRSTNPVDVVTPTMHIEVETSATLRQGLRNLQSLSGERYLAITNKEGIEDALRVAKHTEIGVMDPHGQILKAYGNGAANNGAANNGAANGKPKAKKVAAQPATTNRATKPATQPSPRDKQSMRPAHKRTAAPRLAT